MPDNDTPPSNSETQSGGDPQGATPTTSGTGETPGTNQPTHEDALKELESLRRALQKANNEAKEHRLKAKELDELKQQLETEKLSEKEKLEKRLAELQKQHEGYRLQTQDRLVSAELRSQAAALGFADPSDAVKMLDRAALEFDEDGTPKNAADLLKELLKAKPYLAGKQQGGQTSGGPTNPSRSQSQTPPALSWDVIGKMTPQQYDERRDEIQKWLLANPPRFR